MHPSMAFFFDFFLQKKPTRKNVQKEHACQPCGKQAKLSLTASPPYKSFLQGGSYNRGGVYNRGGHGSKTGLGSQWVFLIPPTWNSQKAAIWFPEWKNVFPDRIYSFFWLGIISPILAGALPQVFFFCGAVWPPDSRGNQKKIFWSQTWGVPFLHPNFLGKKWSLHECKAGLFLRKSWISVKNRGLGFF